MPLYLGLDVGTSSIKALLVDGSGHVRGLVRRPTPWFRSGGGTRLDPGTLWDAVSSTLSEATLEGGEPVDAIGITAFAESSVIADERNMPLAPIIAWHDPGGEEAEDALRRDFGDDRFTALTGQVISRRLTIVKFKWLRESLPAAAHATRLMPVPEWLIATLGGTPVPELSQWSRTGLLGIREPVLVEELANWVGLDTASAPRPQWAGTPAGVVAPTHPIRRLRGAVLTQAGHDHVSALCGVGVAGEADACDSWGNGEALMRQQRTLPDVIVVRESGATVSWSVERDHRVIFRGLGTGLLLRRVLEALRVEPSARTTLDEEAAALPANDALRLPLDAGEGDIAAAARRTSPAAVWRGALEVVFDRVAEGIQAIEDVSNRDSGPLRRIVGCGGWLRSDSIRALKLAAVPRFHATTAPEAAAFGAARLAARAVGAAVPPPAVETPERERNRITSRESGKRACL